MEITTETLGVSTSPSESSKQSRIHFPADPSRSRPLHLETPQRTSSLAFGSTPVRRSSPLNPQATSLTMPSRRRVRSVDTPGLVDKGRSRRAPVVSLVSPSRGLNAMAHRHPEMQAQDDAGGFGIFSDEYDLSHEDPRILQDVQRALKLKARREARLGQHQTAARSSEEPSSPPLLNSIPPTHPTPSPSPRKASMQSELDFGPSIDASSTHIVPASLDNGITLDWSGFAFYERPERRWHLPTVKRKGKEKLPQVHTVVDQQERAHADKLSRIKALSAPHTQRKAGITREQLGRRYDLIYGALSTKSLPPNYAKVARWYGTQDTVVRSSLEKAEPFTWLKHLNRRGSSTPERSPWHLSALIIEEYLHAETRHDQMNIMNAIPEDFSLHNLSSSISPSFMNIQSITTPSHSSSDYSLEQSLKKNSSFEGQISFEPLVESAQYSLDLDAHRSVDSHDTPTNSSSNAAIVNPQNNSSSQRDLASRVLKKLVNNNHNVTSGELHSDSGHNQSERRVDLSEGHVNNHSEPDINPRSDDEFAPRTGITVKVTTPTPGENSDSDPFQASIPHAQNLEAATGRLVRRRGILTSLPSIDHVSKASEIKRQQLEADEEKAFEIKTRLLAEVTTHNHRIRQLLNRISVGVREYDAAQSNAMASLANPHDGLPRELLDAFGHDPAAVTGATRRFRGWKAVDDIHNRLARQRDVFQAFLSCSGCGISIPKSVLDDPVAALVRSVETLEVHNNKIVKRARDVSETLLAVQDMHTNVKTHYKATLSHTSVVYPELSNIVALEESYKDQYQQIWELGMDTLTFLLDTVTPFWRTYGKPIGEDVRDFLIIPLYRNEFTGEPKRYAIRGFPTRSWRHWLGLGLFFLGSILINVLQARAAISSAIHYNLPMIPYESVRWTTLPFFWVGIVIQWWAVVVEFTVVVVQLGILLWWAGWSVKIFT